MSIRPSSSRGLKQPFVVVTLLVVALGVCSWSAFQYLRSAPIQDHIDKGVQFQNQGQNEQAEREWKEAVGLDANNAQVWDLLGDLYLKEHNFPEAKKAFDNLSRVAPNTPELKARMAIVAYQMKDNDKARELAQSELKENPDDIAALQTLVHVEKDVHPDVLLDALKRLVKLQPQNVAALNDLIDELQSRDAYDQIIPLANQMVKLAPADANSYLIRGIALYTANPETDSLAKAKSDLQKALELNPDSFEAHRYLGRLYLRQNQPRLAVTEFEAVGRGRPYASAHLLELSQAYRRLGNIKRADELRTRFTSLRELNTSWISLTDKIQRDPKNGDNYVQLVSLLVNRALGSDPSAYYLYGFQLARGKLLPVQEYLDGAIRLSPQNPQLSALKKQVDSVYNGYIEAGDKAIQAGNYSLANDNATHALLIRPGDQQTLQLVRQVQGAGFNPFPSFSPEAAPDPHKR